VEGRGNCRRGSLGRKKEDRGGWRKSREKGGLGRVRGARGFCGDGPLENGMENKKKEDRSGLTIKRNLSVW